MNTRNIQYISLLLVISTLEACGGGGSSSNSPPTKYPIDSAISAYEQMNHDYTLSAKNGSNSYSLQLSAAPGGITNVGSIAAYSTTHTLTLSENSTLLVNDVSTKYFLISPFKQIVDDDASSGYVTVYANQKDLPESATAGETGAVDTATTYTDASLTVVAGTQTDTWALNAGSGGDASICANTTANSVLNGKSTESDCYSVDSKGNILGLEITLSISGTTLVFK